MKLLFSILKQAVPCKQALLVGVSLLFSISGAIAQNVNTVSKDGPMGLRANTYTGNVYLGRFDFALPNRNLPLVIGWSYNSVLFGQNDGYGNGWSFNYNTYYHQINDSVKIFWADGREDLYLKTPGGDYKGQTGIFDNLTEYQNGKFRVVTTGGTTYNFDDNSHKKITSIQSANGSQLSFTYQTGRLASITSTSGKTVALAYNEKNLLSSITDQSSTPARSWTYLYDAAGNLTTVKNPLGQEVKYKYFVNGPIVAIQDKNANVVNIAWYEGFAVSEIIGCNKRLSFSYDTSTLVTVATEYNEGNANQVTTYKYAKDGNNTWIKSISGNCCGYQVAFEYDANGNKIKETDANGNITLFSYDERGNITSITDPLGQQYTYTYLPGNNKVTSFTDPKGQKAEMLYDANGNLIKLTEPGNLVSTATYNASGDILTTTDPEGNVLNYQYDAAGNLVHVSGPEGFESSFTYNGRGEMTSFTDSRGNTGQLEYDILSRLNKITDPLNKNIVFGYDNNGNTTEINNRDAKESTIKYDASDRLVEFTNTNGEKIKLGYDALDNLVSFTDGLGNTSKFNYDTRNRLIEAINVLGEKVTLGYDGNSNVNSLKLQGGRDLHYSYDRLDRLTSISDNYGTIAEYTYDQLGNVIAYKNASGGIITAAYNANNQITTLTDELGNSYKMEYDKNQNIVGVTNRLGNKTEYGYDGLGRINNIKDQNGNSVAITYDGVGNITRLKDQNNNETEYSYNGLNRLTRITLPDGKYNEFAYDNTGNVISRRYRNGETVQYAYDPMGRLTSKTLPDGNTHQYSYDGAGRLVTATNNQGTVTLTYDALNRVSSETFNGKKVMYAYNATGRIHSILYPDNTLVVRTFDERNNLLSIMENGKQIVGFTYNSLNQPLTRTTGNGVTTQYQYDFAGKLTGMTTRQGEIQQISLSYDKEAQKLKTTRGHQPNGNEQFVYDPAYRLTGYQKGPLVGAPVINTTYQYDALGNRSSSNTNSINTTYITNNLNQLTRKTNSSEDIQYLFDDNGNLIFDGKFLKKYDIEGRLTLDSLSPTHFTRYSYDAFGRQVASTNGITSWEQFYSGSSIIEESVNSIPVRKNILVNFIAPVSTIFNGKAYYYHPNEINSVEAITNENGRVVEKYEYDVYGASARFDSLNNPLIVSPSGNKYGFTGQLLDSATSQLQFYFRGYNPATGTFNQMDLLGYADGMGLYQYVHNNPANGIDILGLKDCNEKVSIQVNEPSTPSNIDFAKSVSDANGTVSSVFSTAETINKVQLQNFKNVTQGADMVEAYAKFGEEAFKNPNVLKAANNLSKASITGPLSKVLGALSKAGPVLGTIDLGIKGASMYETFSSGNATYNQKVDAVADVTSSGGNLLGGVAVAAAGAAGSTIAAPAAVVIAGTAIVDWGVERVTGKNLRGHAEKPVDMLYNAPGKITENLGSKYRLMTDWNYKSWVETFGLEESEFLYNIYRSGKGDTYLRMLNRKKKDCPQDNNPGSRKNNPKGGGLPFSTIVINSYDPNEIIGPVGIGTPRWVSVNDKHPYTINFENSAEATAPAKVVSIYYPIDIKQNGNRFQLGSFGFNNQTFSVPPNTAAYYTRLDVRDSLQIFVDITAGYDAANNRAFWIFQSIDPITLGPVTDPNKGFLLLQDTSDLTSGHGFANFTIMNADGTVTGDQMEATAKILFDNNDTIPTNVETNTIDAFAPTSKISGLPAGSTNNIYLNWTGLDDPGGVGVESYDLYMSADGGSYTLIRSGMHRTDTTITVPDVGTYCFFTLATDSVGNKEALRLADIACTFVSTSLPVTWLYFTGVNQGNDNLLKWATGTEIQVKDFVLERSINAIEFEPIATLKPNGAPARQGNYSYTDKNVHKINTAALYYRVKQVDLDNSFRYSQVVKINLKTILVNRSVVYPNPTNNKITIVAGSDKLLQTNAVLFDNNGKAVKQWRLSATTMSVGLAELPKGLYYLKLKNGETLKIIKN